MVVYTYTGKLTDFGEAPFPTAMPRLWVAPLRDAFIPSGPAVAKRIPVQVSPVGQFAVDLTASVDLNPTTKYSLRCEWLDTDGGGSVGWAQWDFVAALGGGPISTMPGEMTRVWYSVSPPPANRAGIFWINPITDDVMEWEN